MFLIFIFQPSFDAVECPYIPKKCQFRPAEAIVWSILFSQYVQQTERIQWHSLHQRHFMEAKIRSVVVVVVVVDLLLIPPTHYSHVVCSDAYNEMQLIVGNSDSSIIQHRQFTFPMRVYLSRNQGISYLEFKPMILITNVSSYLSHHQNVSSIWVAC